MEQIGECGTIRRWKYGEVNRQMRRVIQATADRLNLRKFEAVVAIEPDETPHIYLMTEDCEILTEIPVTMMTERFSLKSVFPKEEEKC